MTDIWPPKKRSEVMAKIRAKDTIPELLLRRELHKAGLRYRLHVRRVPGVPDIVFPRDRVAIFVNGCFWHGCGLNPTEFSGVDATLQAFRDTLGVPCDTSTSKDSSWVRFYYPLSRTELNEDSVYRRWNDPSGPSVIVRMLLIDLRKGPLRSRDPRHVQGVGGLRYQSGRS